MSMSEDEKAVQGIKDKKARKEAYYTRQRQNASAGSTTQKKIQSKLNLGDEVRSFAKDSMQKLQASGPWSIPGGRAAEAVGGAAKALGSGASRLAKRAGGAIEEEVQHLRNPTPAKQAGGKNSSNPNMNMKDSAKTTASAKARVNKWESEGRAGYAKDAAKHTVNTRPRELTSGQKSLGSSGQGEWHAELAKQSAKKMPAQPKTFNRNGTLRAEGRQKSDRNPVSARKKK